MLRPLYIIIDARQMLLPIFLADVIANFDRCYCQEVGLMLLPMY